MWFEEIFITMAGIRGIQIGAVKLKQATIADRAPEIGAACRGGVAGLEPDFFFSPKERDRPTSKHPPGVVAAPPPHGRRAPEDPKIREQVCGGKKTDLDHTHTPNLPTPLARGGGHRPLTKFFHPLSPHSSELARPPAPRSNAPPGNPGQSKEQMRGGKPSEVRPPQRWRPYRPQPGQCGGGRRSGLRSGSIIPSSK